ncbi:MAG: hypothetical protein M3P85_01345 [Actinomycetota bacterium]|nr:hypothetical protein [Actinomycetota bacterium]
MTAAQNPEGGTRRWPSAGAGAVVGLMAGCWLGYGVGHEFVAWWDRHSGFATLVAGLLTFAVTLAYVVLTRALVIEAQDSIKTAVDANALTEQALAQDRELFKLTLRTRIDSLMPIVTVRMTGRDLVDYFTGHSIGSIPWNDFLSGTYRLVLTFEATNHGSGPAMLSAVEPAVERKVIASASGLKPWRHPTAIPVNGKLAFQIGIQAVGQEVGVDWAQKFMRDESVADVIFKSESKIEQSTFDRHTCWVRVLVEPKGGNFVPTQSISYDYPGDELKMERCYPPEVA